MSEWWDKGTKIPLKDPNFQRILEFYLFNCPSETEKGSNKKGTKKYVKVSKCATTLRAQGWTGRFLRTLLAAMKHTTSGHLEYYTFKTDVNLDNEVRKIEKEVPLLDINFEMIVMTERSDMSKTSAIFYYIRNAFAHGSFSVIEEKGRKIYYLESAKGDLIKARIRLREDTLLKWIKDFSLSPNVLKRTLELERKKNRKVA